MFRPSIESNRGKSLNRVKPRCSLSNFLIEREKSLRENVFLNTHGIFLHDTAPGTVLDHLLTMKHFRFLRIEHKFTWNTFQIHFKQFSDSIVKIHQGGVDRKTGKQGREY